MGTVNSETVEQRGRLYSVIFLFLIILVVFLFIMDLFLGSVRIPFSDIVRTLFTAYDNPEYSTILLKFRLPRAITAILAGFALSVSGLQMQTVFRNPLAGPYVLGISAGASLGVAILVMGISATVLFSGLQELSNWAIAIAAWIGSGLILSLVLVVSSRVRDVMTILILGILFGSATTAIVSILQYFSNETMLKAFIVWTMGSLGSLTLSQLQILGISTLTGILICFAMMKTLNLLLIGENYAKSMGLNIKFARAFVFISTSILAGTVTAFCGPIAFIGIAVPHISRMIFKTSDHKILLPGTMLCGAAILLMSDMLSQLPGYDVTLPINSVTALLGIPIVIFIVIRSKKIAAFV